MTASAPPIQLSHSSPRRHENIGPNSSRENLQSKATATLDLDVQNLSIVINMATPTQSSVDLLILGAGWTSEFLIPLLQAEKISYAATTTTGHDNTIPFRYDSNSNDPKPYEALPSAKTVLITFPLEGPKQSTHLLDLYQQTHPSSNAPHWIQLGTSQIFSSPHWNDYTSPYDKSNPRAIAEDDLLSHGGCVLNLSGLYGGSRQVKNWVIRVATTKAQVQSKKALHLIHGNDVAQAILGAHRHFDQLAGKRWVLTDLRVYDWWDLISNWGRYVREQASAGTYEPKICKEDGPELEYEQWVGELMEEEGWKALPRSAESLGRVLDSREFWRRIGVWPTEGRVK